jgi:hypothetical protein
MKKEEDWDSEKALENLREMGEEGRGQLKKQLKELKIFILKVVSATGRCQAFLTERKT